MNIYIVIPMIYLSKINTICSIIEYISIGLLLAANFYVAFRIRNVQAEFNDSFSILLNCILLYIFFTSISKFF